MKNLFLAALLAIGSLAGAQAWALTLEPYAGYTSVNMTQVNRANDDIWGWENVGYSRHVDSGLIAGLNALAPANAWLDLGVRAEWMQTNQGELYYGYNTSTFKATDQGTLSNLLVGGRIHAPYLFTGMDLALGAWAGYGYATLNQKDPSGDIQDGLFMGSLLVEELETTVKYGLPHHLSLAFTGGWRWANAGQMYDDQHKALYDSANLWENSVKAPANVDYSGITAQGSVSYGF